MRFDYLIVMKYLFVCFISSLSLSIFAQDIEVRKFELMAKDQTAALNPRMDINDVACGLVKVQFEFDNLQFEGNVIGDVLKKSSVYYVYLSKGTKKISLKHPNYLPITIVFANYGVSKIESNNTYSLVLKAPPPKKQVMSNKKKVVIFNITPSLAELYVDNQQIQNDRGTYVLPLTYGTHICSVKCNGFGLYNQLIMVNNKTNSIEFDLTDYYADLYIACSTGDVDIFINNEHYDRGEWRGKVPPGHYLVEARKEGYISMSRSFELHENDSINIVFDALSQVTGSLRIDYKPYDSEVIIDGKSVGATPFYLDRVPVGLHRVVVKRDGFTPADKTISINEGEDLTLEGVLDLKWEISK